MLSSRNGLPETVALFEIRTDLHRPSRVCCPCRSSRRSPSDPLIWQIAQPHGHTLSINEREDTKGRGATLLLVCQGNGYGLTPPGRIHFGVRRRTSLRRVSTSSLKLFFVKSRGSVSYASR